MKVRIDRKKFFVYLVVLVVVAVLFYRYISTPDYHSGFSGTIYIRADGSVDPETLPIHRDGDLYTFTYNIYGSIVVEKDNIVVDGAGYTVQGEGAKDSKGIILSERKNVTLRNMEIRGFWYGIHLEYSLSNSVSGNNITANFMYGIWLNESSRNVVSGNRVLNNGYGVYFEYSLNNNISGNCITDNNYGIYLYRSSNNTLSKNNVTTNNSNGIWLHESSNYNSISENNIKNNGYGIYFLRFVNFNSIFGNNITANDSYGIWLHHSSNNIAAENSVINNGYGIVFSIGGLGGGSDNLIYRNNFVGNADQVYFKNATGIHLPPPPPTIIWDNGFEGNYWSNYTGADKNRDGIGDSPHQITLSSESIQYDRYPLMGLFSSFNTSLGYHVDVISNSTIQDFVFFESNSTIKLRVSNMTVNQTWGFCRIRVPHALMNETYHITIEGAEPYYVNYTLYDDGYNRWIYFSYHNSTLTASVIGCEDLARKSMFSFKHASVNGFS
ncbi:MAG: right-handed parallel beta-helix repeat-containing protein [Candidatus Bathyarchaeota archaeon]|nr:right-handed parallel beta-helix repeat-containing protein [Candidatus Bathyarchaeota archaeon]